MTIEPRTSTATPPKKKKRRFGSLLVQISTIFGAVGIVLVNPYLHETRGDRKMGGPDLVERGLNREKIMEEQLAELVAQVAALEAKANTTNTMFAEFYYTATTE